MTETTSQQILVVGAGPTGLTLAITLRRYGIGVRIIDRAEQPAGVSKALVLWSGSLEALQGMGVIDDFLAAGKRLNALCVGDSSRQLAKIAIGDGIDSPYPFPLLLPQSETEKRLAARLVELGVTIERGVELTGLAQDADGVTATLRHADGNNETAHFAYLVGCDGARSTVRHALDIEFEGYTEPMTYLLSDTSIEGGDLDRNNIYIWWSTGGSVALFPFAGDTWRMFAMREGESDAPPDLAELQSHAERFGPPGIRLYDPQWLSAFRINERLAARYRVGRCFLAGDAAHIHSPAGGQGMNTGIQDAVNIGWKLAYVMAGVGDPALLLSSYEPERRPIAHEVVKAAGQKLHIAFDSRMVTRILKDIAVSIFANLKPVQKMLQTELSETEIVYRDGPLVKLGAPRGHPKRTEVGARARDAMFVGADGAERPLWPLISELNHTLLVFEDADTPLDIAAVTAGVEARLNVLRLTPISDPAHRARNRFNQQGPGWVLIRPDQVVGARGNGSDFTMLDHYLVQVMRRRPS